MRLLVTNDDGVHAEGILTLAAALVAAGHEVIVAAPLEDWSGAAAALGPGHATGLRYQRLQLPALGESVPVYGLDGPPGMCVMAAHLGAFGETPEVVVSGINHGSNTGRSVLFSGTIGAALTAANFGLRGVAISARSGPGGWRFDTAAHFAIAGVDWIAGAPAGTVLNINTPFLGVEQVKGVRTGELAPFGVVRTVLEDQDHERLHLVLREVDERLPEGCDTDLVREGFVSVNTLVGPRADGRTDAAPVVAASAGVAVG